MTDVDIVELVRGGYAAFNARDIDRALASMRSDVQWANGWEGGHVCGHDALRDYWTRQWQQLDPLVTPIEINVHDDDVDVLVDQTVRDANGVEITAGTVRHRYRIVDGRIARMDIAPAD